METGLTTGKCLLSGVCVASQPQGEMPANWSVRGLTTWEMPAIWSVRGLTTGEMPAIWSVCGRQGVLLGAVAA